jgi:PAS domain S-box-containing protein
MNNSPIIPPKASLEVVLPQHNRLLKILMDLSLGFINVPLNRLDQAINEALKQVAQFNRADRAYLITYDWARQEMNNSHEWCAAGISPEIENLQQVPMELFPEWMEAHTAGRPVHIPDVSALPPGNNLREILEPQGIKTLITLPLTHGQQCLGFVGFDAVNHLQRWTDQDVTLLQILAELLVNAEVRRQNELAVRDAEARLRTNEARLSKAQRIANLGYWELDIATQTVLWTEEVFNAFGLDPTDGIPEYGQIRQYLHPEDLDFFDKTIANAIENSAPYAISLRAIRPDGTIRYCQIRSEPAFDHAGKLVRLDGTLLDVTERVEIEQALRDLTDRLELALRSGNIGIWEWSQATSFTGDARMRQLLDIEDGEDLSSTIFPEDWQRLGTHFSAALQDDQKIEVEFRVRLDLNAVRYLKAYGIIQRSIQHPNSRVIGVAFDVTDNKQIEQVLRQALEKEKELSELKTSFVSMVSHEFRNPLAIMMAAVETLSAYRAKLTDAQIDQRLERVRQQIHFLRDMIDDVLQMSRIESGRITPNPAWVDLDALTQAVIHDFRGIPDLMCDIQYCCGDGPILLYLDERLMGQVISNLLSNALKYTPAGKRITVSLQAKDDEAILCVQDDGIGIPPEDMEHLFEPFHRATNVGAIGGTGLGLPIVKKLVNLHGGYVDVHSEEGAGSAFRVYLPYNQEDNDGKNSVN